MINKPDYDRAAAAAMQLLIDHNVTETPINPLPILLNYPGVRVLPYTKMASDAGMDRKELIPIFGTNRNISEHPHYDISNCDLIGRKEMLQKCSIFFFMLPCTVPGVL